MFGVAQREEQPEGRSFPNRDSWRMWKSANFIPHE